GNPSVLNFATNLVTGPKTGFGGFFDAILGQNIATASVDDLAIVGAHRDVNVHAHTDDHLVTVVFAGDYAKKTGVDGAIIYDRVKDETLAYIEDRAIVTARHDVDLDAHSDVSAVSIAPALAIGGKKGVGIGASFSDVRVTTLAFIGDANDEVPVDGYGGVLGSVAAGHDVSLHATSNPKAFSIAASAGVATSGGQDAPGPPDSGKALGGTFAFNELNQTTAAFIESATVTGLDPEHDPARPSVTLSAHGDSVVLGIAASGAGGSESLAFAGGVTFETLTQHVSATVGDDATVEATDVSPHAEHE